MIDHRAVSKDVLAALDKHHLNHDEATKCLIYTTAKLLKAQFPDLSDEESAEMLSEAALRYRDMILKVNRMFKRTG